MQPRPSARARLTIPYTRRLMDATDATFGPLSPIIMTRLPVPSPGVLTPLQQNQSSLLRRSSGWTGTSNRTWRWGKKLRKEDDQTQPPRGIQGKTQGA
ncbi:hypothetical protein CGRA01v4_03284 [Colletotrichum graminicola]|nr:hypothetical protein CGRA01v4_03284 [Colletotrichum graminicola]